MRSGRQNKPDRAGRSPKNYRTYVRYDARVGHHLVEELSGKHSAFLETGTQLAERTRQRELTGFGPLVVANALAPLFISGGLERGHIYGLAGDASVSLLFALMAPATQQGSWCAMVNMPTAGLMAAHETGVALHRTVCVDVPATSTHMSNVLGSLVDGIDLVAVRSAQCSSAEVRRIASRVKAQGSVLLLMGNTAAFSPDAVLVARTQHWQFQTHAVSRTVHVTAQGRRLHAQRSCVIALPHCHNDVSGAS